MKWEVTQLGNLIAVKHGYAFKSQYFTDSGKYILLSPGNFHEKGGLKLKGEKEKYYSADFPEEYLLKSGDLIVVMTDLVNTAPILGGSAIIPEDDKYLHNQRLGLIEIKGKNKLDKGFLYHLLNTNQYRGQIRGSASGATVRHTAPERIYKCKLKIPVDLSIQQRIGSILTSYDDLIENNLRRIKILDDSARQLYKEWFVRLRFPGYEHTNIIKGVPEGWEKKTLSEISESIDYGYTESAQFEDIGPKFLRITDIVPNFIDWSKVPHCPISDDKKEQFLLREGDIVVARTGATVGYAKRLHKRYPEAVFASYLVRFQVNSEISNTMVGTFVESEDYKAYVKSRVGGAAQPNANAKVLGGVQLLIPTKQLQREFDEIVSKLLDQKEVLQIQNQKLIQARDILLPKLMSGEVEV